MTITSVTYVGMGDSWQDDETGYREYEQIWRVESDNPQESPVNVRLAAGLPAPYAVFPGDPAAVAKSRNATRRTDTRLMWEVSIRFEFDPEEPEDPEEDPTSRPAEIDWTSSLEVEPIFKDRDGNALVNSAGDYFDPPIEFPIARWQANVQKNVSSVPFAILDWAGAINSAPYSIDGVSIEARKSRLVSVGISKKKRENEVDFRTITLGIEFQRDEYLLTPLDQGFRFKDGTTLKDILVADSDGAEQRPSAPVLLDGMGAVLVDPDTSTAVFLEFNPPVEEIDFSILPLT